MSKSTKIAQKDKRQSDLCKIWACKNKSDAKPPVTSSSKVGEIKSKPSSGVKRNRESSPSPAPGKNTPPSLRISKKDNHPRWNNVSLPNGPMLLLHCHIGGGNTSERKSTRKDISSLPTWNDNVVFKIYGKECKMRRRICQFSTDGALTYSYSGLKTMVAPAFPDVIHSIKCQVESALSDYVLSYTNCKKHDVGDNLKIPSEFIKLVEEINNCKEGERKEIFNYCLLNHYRSGEEYMGWHSDDEKMLDNHSPIASVSFGATRNFDIRAKKKVSGEKRTRLARIPLGDGDLLLMFPPMQDHYEHGVPVEKRVAGDRINLTFRRISG